MRRFAIVLCILCTACSQHAPAQIAQVDVERVVTHWPQMQSQSDAIVSERRALAQTASVLEVGARTRAAEQLDLRAAKLQITIAQAVRRAAERIARDRRLEIVVTRDYVAYGGVDITDEVTKMLVDQPQRAAQGGGI